MLSAARMEESYDSQNFSKLTAVFSQAIWQVLLSVNLPAMRLCCFGIVPACIGHDSVSPADLDDGDAPT